MKVVYLADAPYVHTQRWVRHFASRGDEAHIISFRPARIEGAQVHYVGGFERMGKARYLLHARRIGALVRSLEPDLVHALHLTSYGFLAGLSGVQPSIVSVWGTDVLEAPGLSPAHRWITRQALARAGAITATGVRLAEATIPHAPQGKPVSVIPYGVDLAMFRPQPRPERPRIVIGAVARLSEEKGLEYLLRAVGLIVRRAAAAWAADPSIEVVLAGDGPWRERLESISAEERINDRVRFLGEVTHDAVPGVLQSFDIFAMPSTWEGFGVAAVEASAMELPVIASDVHGIPDVVVHNETGILVKPRDVDALAAAIDRLAGDAELRRRMGAAGRGFVERHYRWQDNAVLMEHLYGEMAARA